RSSALFLIITLPPPRSTLFPYTTLFRSRLSGLIADLALALNLLILLAAMAGFRATLTLPGIAGVVLTIGMAVGTHILMVSTTPPIGRAHGRTPTTDPTPMPPSAFKKKTN